MRAREEEQYKTLVVGLDGATFDVILPLMNRGLLPNLAHLMQEGVWAKLESTVHPVTPQAWTSFMTGMNAGKHGIYDFVAHDTFDYHLRYVNGSFRKVKSLWALLSEAGKRVAVVNVPFTYPPEPVNGVLVSGLDAPGIHSGITYPERLLEEVIRQVGALELRGAFPIGQTKTRFRPERFGKIIQNLTAAAQYLFTAYPSDFSMIVFTSPDHAQHLFWRHWESAEGGSAGVEMARFGGVIPMVYERVDAALGQLIDCVGRDARVLIMSDHGAGRLEKVVYLNRWLEQHGWLVYKRLEGGVLTRLLGGVKLAAKRNLPRRYRDLLKTLLPRIRDATDSYLFASNIDWSQTKAYATGTYGNICVNLKNRQSQGTVAPGAEYESFRDEICKALQEFRSPDGRELLVERAYKREELFHGDFVESAPDIVVGWRDYAYFTKATLLGKKGQIFGDELYIESSDFEHTGTHRRDGVFILQGPGIKNAGQLEPVSIYDLAPTILYFHGCEIPADMDGQVLTQVFDEGHLRSHPVRYSRDGSHSSGQRVAYGYSPEEQEEIEARLRELGYL